MTENQLRWVGWTRAKWPAVAPMQKVDHIVVARQV